MSFGIPGLRFRRTVRTSRNTSVNVSGGGASVTARAGRRLTVNSRHGQATVKLGKGLSFRSPRLW